MLSRNSCSSCFSCFGTLKSSPGPSTIFSPCSVLQIVLSKSSTRNLWWISREAKFWKVNNLATSCLRMWNSLTLATRMFKSLKALTSMLIMKRSELWRFAVLQAAASPQLSSLYSVSTILKKAKFYSMELTYVILTQCTITHKSLSCNKSQSYSVVRFKTMFSMVSTWRKRVKKKKSPWWTRRPAPLTLTTLFTIRITSLFLTKLLSVREALNYLVDKSRESLSHVP